MMRMRGKVWLVLLAMGWIAGATGLAQPYRESDPKQAAVDRYGDPLPPGAVARLGSFRLRHTGPVWAVGFAPDGKTMVSGGAEDWAFLWDVATGKRLREFRQKGIKSLAIDPQGKTVALASLWDGNVKRYELATGKELPAIPGNLKGIYNVVFSPGGKLLATVDGDHKIRLWNAATARGIDSWQDDRVNMPSLRFTPDGKSLAYILFENGPLRFRDVATGTERKPPGPLASTPIDSFCFAADGKTLITSSANDAGLLQLWDKVSGKEIRTVTRTHRSTAHVLLAPDGKSVWTADFDGRIVRLCKWDLATGKQLLHLSYPSYYRTDALALSPEGKHLAAGDFEGNVYLWDTKTGRKALDFGGHHGSADAVVFTPDGRQLWTGGSDHTIRLWSTVSSEQLHQFSTERDNDYVHDLALRPDGKLLAAAVTPRTNTPFTDKCDVRLWDLATNTEREPLRGHGGWVWGIAFSHDGRMLASRSWDQTVRLWDVATGKQRQSLRCQWQAPWGIDFTPDDSRVVSFLDRETVAFWDVESGRPLRRLNVKPSREGTPLLSRDGRMLIASGLNGPLRAWEVASGKERRRFDGIKPTVSLVTLSSDNRILAVWIQDGKSIELWDVRTGALLGKFDGGGTLAYPSRLAFSPDGCFLASALYDGTTVIWDVARLTPALRTVKHSLNRLEELWNELGGEDAAKAYRALLDLAAAPERSVPLLRQRLAAAAAIKVDSERIARFQTQLDSAEFEVREKASQGLQELGILAEPALRRALRDKPSLEVRRRLEQILDKLESGARPTDQLQILRAVEVLELIGSSEAEQVLRERSQGSPDSWLTHEAKASLARLAARP
jgi:WD40 repeat protein